MQTTQNAHTSPSGALFRDVRSKLKELNELISDYTQNSPGYSTVFDYFRSTNAEAFNLLYDPMSDLIADVAELKIKATEEGLIAVIDAANPALSKFPIVLLRRHFE